MSQENIIIGAGITGLASAFKLISNDKCTTIYEITDSIGGVLKDYKNSNGIYFNSCQYINSENQWFQNFLNKIKKEFIEFNHTYSSFTDLYGSESISNNFAGITIDFDDDLTLSNRTMISLEDRLSKYPSAISIELLKWVKRFGIDPQFITHDGSIGLQISSIFIKNRVSEIQEIKSAIQEYDLLYGLPRSLLGLDELKAMLPIKGYTSLFEKLALLANKEGIKINYNSPSIPFWINKDTLIIKNKGETIEANKIIWTCNPTALIKFSENKKIDSASIKMKIYVANLIGSINNPHYIQVYSKNSNIVRIFIYQINGISKVTIECFNEENSNDEIIFNAEKILKCSNINLKINIETLDCFFQKRYFLTTIKDQKIFNEFYVNTKNSNLINGQWDTYGRDQKIFKIFDQLRLMNE